MSAGLGLRAGSITADVLSRVRERAGAVVGFALGFKVVNLVFLAPFSAEVLRLFLLRWGRCSVGNFEIAAFFLSVPGLVALVVVGAVMLASLYLELAGLMLLTARRPLTTWMTLHRLADRLPRLIALALRQTLVYLVVAMPFLLGAFLAWRLFWSGHDLNGLIILKPPTFWVGASLGGLLGLAYLLLALRLFVRWLFAVPIVLFEPDTTAATALRRSVERTRGRVRPLAAALAIWLLTQGVLAALVLGVIQAGSSSVLGRVGTSLSVVVPVTAVLLLVHTAVAVMVSVVQSATFAALVVTCYERDLNGAHIDEPPTGPRPASLPARWLMVGSLVIAAVLATVIGLHLLNGLRLDDRIEITAHRGGAATAPENTVAAIRGAIADRADWTEIDVQLTADRALVVLHDTDLARAGRPNRLVKETTLEEIRRLDVGVLFGPDFRGERIPTLDEVLAAAGDQIGLTIELKPHSKDDVSPLVDAALAALRRAGRVGRTRICSQSYEGIQEVKRRDPTLPVGFIAGMAIGRLAGLDVDFLMVNQSLATRRLVDVAAVRHVAIHAWTVNDPGQLTRLLDRGVAVVITDRPAALRARLEEIRRLSTVERLLLRARELLAD